MLIFNFIKRLFSPCKHRWEVNGWSTAKCGECAETTDDEAVVLRVLSECFAPNIKVGECTQESLNLKLAIKGVKI